MTMITFSFLSKLVIPGFVCASHSVCPGHHESPTRRSTETEKYLPSIVPITIRLSKTEHVVKLVHYLDLQMLHTKFIVPLSDEVRSYQVTPVRY